MQAIKIASLTLLLGSFATAALAHGDEEKGYSKAISYRTSVMDIFKWNIGPMGAMVSGKVPYDQATFTRHAKDLAAAAHLDLLAGFPDGSDEGDDTDARTDIWMDWDNFVQKYDTLKQASSELAQTAAGGNLEAIKPKFHALGKACKSCHDAFRD